MNPRAALAPFLASKLAKVCGRFGSSFDGERATAAAMADRMIRNAGLTWDDVILQHFDEPVSDDARIRFCAEHTYLLTAWEVGFVASIGRRSFLTAKQTNVLDAIYRKVQRCRS